MGSLLFLSLQELLKVGRGQAVAFNGCLHLCFCVSLFSFAVATGYSQTAGESGMNPPQCHTIKFSIEGPGEIVATGNGDATSLVCFASTERPAFNGLESGCQSCGKLS